MREGMRGWLNRMTVAFGATFLQLVVFVYFTQGFRSFVWTAVSYQLKDILKLSPSASQFVVSVSFFPWSIKPLYGILSDCIPISGRRRKPYLIIASVLSFLPWLVLGLLSVVRNSPMWLTVFLCLQNIGSAMADVVTDAMIAEAVRLERAAYAGDLQSLSWFAMAIGGVLGSLLGGIALLNLRISSIFLLFSILPIMQLLSCYSVDEAYAGRKDKAPVEGSTLDSIENVQSVEGDVFSNGRTSLPNLSSSSNFGIHKAQQRKGKGKRTAADTEFIDENHPTLRLQWFLSLKSALRTLSSAFKRPVILRPMAWFFFSHAAVPNFSTAMFYYQTEVLHLDASFLGTARVVGWCGLMLGTFMYNRHLKRMKLRIILLWAHIGLSLLILFDIALVSRAHTKFGISDRYMVLIGSALSDAVNQFKMMPFLIISGRLCPPGIEGTLFALFMSINNLGSTLGSFLGASLASILNISPPKFENLLLGIILQLIATLIPITFLFLIPQDATGSST
ncbi:major facilitator superfamily protein [Wolffia australiana]